MRRKPLFPPPRSAAGKSLRHKGRQSYSLLTVNGRIRLARIRWHDAQTGSRTELDAVVDEAEQAISHGVREMACRLNSIRLSLLSSEELGTLRRTDCV